MEDLAKEIWLGLANTASNNPYYPEGRKYSVVKLGAINRKMFGKTNITPDTEKTICYS